MIICVCRGLSDKFIEQLVDAGADSVERLGAQCRAGTDCGNCRVALQTIIDIRQRKKEDSGRAA